MNNSNIINESNNLPDVPTTDSNETKKHITTPATQDPIGGIIIANRHRINVDDNFHVLNLSGESLRFQWSIVIMNYCNKDVQEAYTMYKELFINYNEFMYPTNCGTNKLYREAFDHEFGIFITNKKAEIHHPQPNTGGTIVPPNKYLTDYEEQILQAIDTYNCVQIVAPTGTGKTVLMNHIASKRKCIIVTPFNSQLNLYRNNSKMKSATEAEQIEYNYVCVKYKEMISVDQVACYSKAIEPFVGLEKTMDNPSEIEIEKEVSPDQIKFDPEKTNICIWDRFVQKMHNLNSDFKDHIIIIDESHLLFSDRSYRKSAVKFVKLIKKFRGKVVLVTATPTWEHQLLDIDQTLTFRRDRTPIRLNWIDSLNPYNTIERLIGVLRNPGFKIVVFSDVNARKLYENYIAKEKYETDKITMFHSKFLDHPSNNASVVMRNEFLDRDLTICTRMAYAGINFKNVNEKIIVIIEVNSSTDSAYIVQALGRIRKAEVEAYVVFDNRAFAKDSAMERLAASKEFEIHKKDPIIQTFLVDNEIFTNWAVEFQLEKYYHIEADKSVIIRKLCESGYIKVLDYGEDIYVQKRKGINKYKRKESDRFIKEIINTESRENIDFTKPATSYWIDWLVRYHNIRTYLRPKDIKSYTNLRKQGSPIEIDAILTELEDLVKLCTMSKRTRKKLLNDYQKYVKEVTKGWKSKLAITIFASRCKGLNDILKEVIVFKGVTNINMTLEDIIDTKINIIEREKARIKVIRSKNGKKGGMKSSRKQKVTLQWIGDDNQRPDGLNEDGKITFESKTLCQKYLAVSNDCFYKFCNTNGGALKLREKWKLIK